METIRELKTLFGTYTVDQLQDVVDDHAASLTWRIYAGEELDRRKVRAVVKGNGVTAERVAAYLPANYSVMLAGPDGVLIEGVDKMGWTFNDYVEPRLASGCMFATRCE